MKRLIYFFVLLVMCLATTGELTAQWCAAGDECLIIDENDKNCGTADEFTSATKPCPGTGCISGPDETFLCNDGSPEGGEVNEERPISTSTEWQRWRKQPVLDPITQQPQSGQPGQCAVQGLVSGLYYCTEKKPCQCQQVNGQWKCVTDPNATWVEESYNSIYDIVLASPNPGCTTP